MFMIFRFRNGKNFDYVIPLKNGRFITFSGGWSMEDNQVYKWVSSNYETYKNVIDTDLNESYYFYYNAWLKQRENKNKHKM